MPVTRSAKKALRVAIRRREENVPVRLNFKKAIKSVKKALSEGADQVSGLFVDVQSSLDKAAKQKTIHPNKASRLKSRLAKKINQAAAAPQTKPAAVKKTASTAKKSTASKKGPATRKKK